MPTPPTETAAAREVTVVRVIDVPARHVFLAYARREHLMRWFGPAGYPVTHCEADFRVGGKWRMVMTGPDGKQGPPFGGTYLEIVPDRRIVFDDAFEDGHGGEMNLKNTGRIVFTVTLAEADGKTTLTLHLLFDSAAMKDEYLGIGMLQGIASGFDQMEGVVAELARAG